MSFRDQIPRDMEQIFLNPEEFATYHDINGTRVKCLLGTDLDADTSLAEAEGVFSNRVKLYFRERTINMPKVGELFRLDGSYHVALKADIEDGALVITAEAQKQ